MALRKVSEDGRYRLTVHYDECAEHPLNWCDFPLHMDDWCRDYSANPTTRLRDKTKHEHYESCEACMRSLLYYYGDGKKIIDLFVSNYSKEKHERYELALTYDRSRREWLVLQWSPTWKAYDGAIHEAHWCEEASLCCKRKYITFSDIAEYLSEEDMAGLLNTCLTDEVKVMSYYFGYHGSIGFCSNVGSDCHGLAWIVKSEAVGDGKWLTEEQWRTMDCYDLTKGEREEICAWAEGDVFWFEVEKKVLWKVHRECLSEERTAEDYEDEEWEQLDSCGGFYGLDYAVQYAISENKLPKMIEAA
jgi:hypothetical protein